MSLAFSQIKVMSLVGASAAQFMFGGLWYSALPTSGAWAAGVQKYLNKPNWPQGNIFLLW